MRNEAIATEFQSGIERRAAARFESNLPVLLLDCLERPLSVPLKATLLDISRIGMRLRVWHDVPVGTQLSLSVDYNGFDSLCVGEVIWKRDSNAGMIYGLRVRHWTYLDPNLTASLRSLENRFQKFPQAPLKLQTASAS